MSQARVETVKKCRKAQKPCEKCGVELPVGSAYRYFYVGFRSTWKRVRCMKSECSPTRAERESSMLAEVYGAQDDAEKAIRDAGSWDDIKAALDDVAQVMRDVASQYEEASQDQNGNTFNTDAEERAQQLESAADEVESIDKEDTKTDCDACSGANETECDTCGGSGWADEDEKITCADCNGTGTIDCTECEDGQVEDLDTMRDEAIDEMMNVDMP